MRVLNFSQTFSKTPNRLFSASVVRKFLTVSPLSPPVSFWSSDTTSFLSALVRVGAAIIEASLRSDLRVWPRIARARETWSREVDLTEAEY